MTRRLRKFSRVVAVAVAAVVLLGSSKPAYAGCFISFNDCLARAAGESSYWRSVLASADCEVDLASCLRRELIGR
jgi:hypothetical protein